MSKIDAIIKDCDKLAARMDALNKRADVCFNPKRADASNNGVPGAKFKVGEKVKMKSLTHTGQIQKPTYEITDVTDKLYNGMGTYYNVKGKGWVQESWLVKK